jgi:hypothetical protein
VALVCCIADFTLGESTHLQPGPHTPEHRISGACAGPEQAGEAGPAPHLRNCLLLK